MTFDLNEMSGAAVDRYGLFLNVLRSQSDTVFRRGPTDETLRNEALAVAQGAARSFLTLEQDRVTTDTIEVARRAHSASLTDLGVSGEGLAPHLEDFSFDSAYFITRIIAAQSERDIMSMAQHIQGNALRIDLYVRSGRHTPVTAAAQVMIEDNQMPAFRFIDRMGRKYKASKHIRDTYRQHLLNVYNEVYMDVVASYGHDSVRVDHPNPDYKWFGAELAIVTGSDADIPLYYDVRDEIFHPSSEAVVTISALKD